MKKIRLLIAALLCSQMVFAQNNQGYTGRSSYEPTVYLISVREVDTIYNVCDAQQAVARNRAAMDNAVQDFQETHRYGFQQVEKPQFIFTTRNNRFSLALGGYINLRAAYEFDGRVNNIDFVPYDIPMVDRYTNQRIMMDASTSRLYLKAIANTRALGRVVVFVDGDFRGGSEGSYTPRVRSAYVNFCGFTFGRDVTTFCDLLAAPNTVDFQGPNAYNLRFNTMIRWSMPFADDCLRFGIAAEMPNVSGTYNTNFAAIPQRIPDIPAYLQVQWGPQRKNHIRASGVFRGMYARNLRTGKNDLLYGWGVQASGHISVFRAVELFFNGVYGEGITPYIQDLTGSGLDFTPNPNNPEKLQTMPMYGWQAAAQINFIPGRFFLSGGFSTVEVRKHNGYYAADEYKRGQYIFGNIYYYFTPRCKIAAEYLYGTRKNMNGLKNHANRVNLMVQYSF